VSEAAGLSASAECHEVSKRTPLLADLKPGGRYVAVDLDRAGGIPLLAQRLVAAGLIDGEQMTPSGRTIREEANMAVETPGQDVVHPVSDPLKPNGGLVILKGNLAPEGGVVKIAGHERHITVGLQGSLIAKKMR